MSSLFANPIALTVLPPLAAGVLLGLIAWLSGSNRAVMALAWGVGILFVYWLLEGVPPLPPIAAKQKLGYLIGLGALLGVAASLLPTARNRLAIASAILAAVAVVWLGWSKISAGGNAGALLLAALLAILMAAGVIGWFLNLNEESVDASSEHSFIPGSVLLTTAVAGSIIAAAGLFLGMGQMLGGLAAMTGGALAVSYLALLLRGGSLALLAPGAVLALGNAVLCAFVLTGLLGPSPSVPGLIVAAAGPLAALWLRPTITGLLPRAPALRPILAGAILAIPAFVASLYAVLTGTSPFVAG